MSDPVLHSDRIPRPPGTPESPARHGDPLRQEIAATAARLVADAGLDYGSAKRKAIEMLLESRSAPRGAVPDNDEIDTALREHLALFDDDHPARVQRMRRVALALMQRLARFDPYLTGSVWKGIVAEHAPIHLQLFHDDIKDVAIALLDDGLEFEVGEMPHFRNRSAGKSGGDVVEALMMTWRGEPVMLTLYLRDDLRGALRGLPAERGDTAGVERLIAAHEALGR